METSVEPKELINVAVVMKTQLHNHADLLSEAITGKVSRAPFLFRTSGPKCPVLTPQSAVRCTYKYCTLYLQNQLCRYS